MATEEENLKSAIQHAAVGRTAIEDSRYTEAADSLGQAADLCRQSLTNLLCTQTSVLISAERYDEARKVSQSATRVNPMNGTVWYWNGLALFKLDDKDKAKVSFKKAVTWEKDLAKRASYMDWVNQCQRRDDILNTALFGLGSAANGAGSATSARTAPAAAAAAAAAAASAKTTSGAATTPILAAPSTAPLGPVAPPGPPRMTWYQSATHINIDIYAKNVIQEESSIAIEDDQVRFQLKRPDAADYVFERQLFGTVVPAESSWNISRFKFEARLKKAGGGEPWRALDKEAQVVSPAVQAAAESKRMKDARTAREKEWNEYAEGELKDYKEDDSAMSLFRTIYKDANEDMRRAMMKSYSESGGKVLSTNWDDVKKEKVEYKEKD